MTFEKGVNMNFREFYVNLNLPEKLKKLESLAYNLWWTYNNSAKDLFTMIDPDRWRESNHNPIEVLSSLSQKDLDRLESDPIFLSRMDSVWDQYMNYLSTPKWFELQNGISEKDRYKVAYLSMEYGVHESIQTYAGGLGILSGDHCKSASDLGLPFVAVGILYKNGYFHQYLNTDGWQQEYYPNNDFVFMPVTSAKIDDKDVFIEIPSPHGNIVAKVWNINFGYSKFVMLDTDIPQNNDFVKKISGKLYDGDSNMRLLQEILLGIGGVRALEKLNINPTVYHLNEGHPTFSLFERVHNLMTKNNLSYDEAIEFIRKTTLFTTHTPVPAGFDVFSEHEIINYLSPIYYNSPVKVENMLYLGKFDESNRAEPFSLAVAAVKTSVFRNGVSRLHGKVSRKIFSNLWKNVPDRYTPIDYVTNGVHLPTWIAPEFKAIFNRYLGDEWHINPYKLKVWDNVDDIPDLELYENKKILRSRLVSYVRNKLRDSVKKRGGAHSELIAAQEALNPNALTIGFARRFATYKRGYLLFRDRDRLLKILSNKDKPVQIVIAGKAHPKDTGGKDIIKNIVHISKMPEFRDKVIFLEDYDIQLAKYLVRGVDLWINTPRRPMEASGTSGMKVGLNGGINFSILDGWWDEAYNGKNGWSIGFGEDYDNFEYQDFVESEEIYDKLENEIVPAYYNIDKSGLPREWLSIMKESIKTSASYFNTSRMVIEYTEKFYHKLHEMHIALSKETYKDLKEFVNWKKNIFTNFHKITVVDAYFEPKSFKLSDEITFVLKADIKDLKQDDLSICAIISKDLEQNNGHRFLELKFTEIKDHVSVFENKMKLFSMGKFKVAFGIFPKHEFIFNRFENNLYIWA
jgi:starch phosphorylase